MNRLRMGCSHRVTCRHNAATHTLTYQNAGHKLAGGNTIREAEDEEMNQMVFGCLASWILFGAGFELIGLGKSLGT